MRDLRAVVSAAAATCLWLPAASFGGELGFEGHGGYFGMTAKRTAEALYGSTGAPLLGGAVRYTFWRGAFISAGMRSFSREGERVFVASSGAPVQKLGFPLSMRETPILLSAGYRLREGRAIVPYLSLGAAITRYEVKSQVAGESFDESLRKTGFVVAAGVEARVFSPLVRLGGEVGYTTVNAIGTDGVSQVYGEKDIGGLHAVGKLVIAFGL